MRISDWSSDVCSSDLGSLTHDPLLQVFWRPPRQAGGRFASYRTKAAPLTQDASASTDPTVGVDRSANAACRHNAALRHQHTVQYRSEEHTSELQSLMRISYAVFCLKKKNNTTRHVR